MSYSFLCAVSGQSIPIYTVEPTPVVVVLPDGELMTGTWDGYGYVLPLGVDPMAAAAQVQRYFTAEYHLPRRLAPLLGVEPSDTDAILAAVRMVKARYYEPGRHAFANLEPCKPCPRKGLLYRDSGDWNNPRRPPAKVANLPPWLARLRGDRDRAGPASGDAPDGAAPVDAAPDVAAPVQADPDAAARASAAPDATPATGAAGALG